MTLISFKKCLFVVLSSFVYETLGDPQAGGVCSMDCECSPVTVCVNGTCVDPCEAACGANTDCHLVGKVPMCTCKPCFSGDPLEACTQIYGEECTKHEDCSADKSCVLGTCEDPCLRTCGANTNCSVRNHRPECACLTGYIWTENTGCTSQESPECKVNDDCPADKKCQDSKCVDVCTSACGVNSVCRATKHYPTCACVPGYTGDPLTGCYSKCYNFNGTETSKNFLINYNNMNRANAFNYCRSQGMSLVSITSAEKQLKVEQFLSHQIGPLGDVWTSGVRVPSDVHVLWTNGRSNFTDFQSDHYTTWNWGECIELNFRKGYKWRIIGCIANNYVLCEDDCQL